MPDEIESAGDALTGAIVAKTIDDVPAAAPVKPVTQAASACRNCGAASDGAFCSTCGQPKHIHRSLLSLGHDILHGVFHFEGRIWRTLPLLVFKPGHLTRRYIDGERAKFVSPMALFLFMVFLMFAVFSFTSASFLTEGGQIAATATENFKRGNTSAIEITGRQLAAARQELESPDLSPARRLALEKEIAELESALKVMESLVNADIGRLQELQKLQKQDAASPNIKIEIGETEGSSPAGRRLVEALKRAQENPGLLLYKVKTNSYKFSWALIPISVPFLWLLFFWRRDVNLYDHAIFATYSLSFMMLLLVVLAIAGAAGVGATALSSVFGVVAPIHLYRHLKHTYGLSPFGAVVRVFALAIVISIILALFIALLFVLGVFG